MSKSQEIKIIPPKIARDTEQEAIKRPNYIAWLIALMAIYFALLIIITILPLQGYMKILSLILGTFLLFDILHSIKYHVRNKQ